MIEGEGRLMEPGMCFSIEPGIYLPDRFGVRIEDIVTVTEDGGRRLNNTDHAMRIVSWRRTPDDVRAPCSARKGQRPPVAEPNVPDSVFDS